jgi:hypothetical protein
LKELGLDQNEIKDFSKVDLKVAVLIANKMSPQQISYEDALEVLKKENFIPTQSTQLSRGEFAKVIDLLAKPFESIPINHQGLWIH